MRVIRLQITGMTCSACSTRIEKALRRMDGVQEAAISLATSTAVVSLQEGTADAEAVASKIRQLGYGAEPDTRRKAGSQADEAQIWRFRFIVALTGSLPLLAAMLGHLIEPLGSVLPAFVSDPTYQLLLATLLFGYAGYPFFAGAYSSIRRGGATMDVLVALGIGCAYVFSVCRMLFPQPLGAEGHGSHSLYFDSIAMIVSAVTLGKWLEASAKGSALRSLQSLEQLRACTGRRLVGLREEAEVPAELLRAEERVKVLAGEWIPVDGRVEDGVGDVDESLLSGEAAAVWKQAGDTVYAGTRLLSGQITLRAACSSAESRLSRLIGFVEHAQMAKPRIQRQADRAAAYLVPAIVALALITYAGWALAASASEAVSRALAVLLVACPCALGLATPLSVLIGSSLAARKGIIFKEASSLETLSRVTVFLFDKTGTLTRGQPAVTGLYTAEDLPELRATTSSQAVPLTPPFAPPPLAPPTAAVRPAPQAPLTSAQLLQAAASLGRGSEHPLAKAVVREALAKRLQPVAARDVHELPGAGLSGFVGPRFVAMGRDSWLRAQGISCPAELAGLAAAQADSELHVAVDGRWAGALTFRDQARDDARSTIRQLSRRAGIVMATGDRAGAAGQAALDTGIGQVHAQLLPEHKMQLILRYQNEGHVVAMVGDGANDVAALAAADIGIVLAGASEAALQAGDVALVGGRLSRLGLASDIALGTMRNIKQNLAIACCYNAIMIPLAVAGALDPRAACLGMASSSLLVVGNALRLNRLERSRRSVPEGGRL
ncbi:cation-translocating P-type ATPase [Paenibacillus athensensis]|nr:cation-translocating P-type ATPase [Paenibacillus athensensis]MCD1261426.1 cation-translocating P-type ATPase [Paenibacillus athensensis]